MEKFMKQIDKLTAKQEEQIDAWREEWLKVGRATGPADLEAIRPVIDDFYANAKYGMPPPHLWRCESPIMVHLLLNIIGRMHLKGRTYEGTKLRTKLRQNVRYGIGYDLKDDIKAHVTGYLEANLKHHLTTELHRYIAGRKLGGYLMGQILNLDATLRANLGSEPVDHIEALLAESLAAALDANAEHPITPKITQYLAEKEGSSPIDSVIVHMFHSSDIMMHGSFDAWWVAHYLFPQRFVKPIHSDEQMRLLNNFAAMARSAFWWFPFQGVCFVCDRPSVLRLDAHGRLHSLEGPAMAFTDGYTLHAIHGVVVPAAIVERPDSITVEMIDAAQNAEVRRVMVELLGAVRYISESGAALVHEDEIGALYRRDMPDDEPLVMVKVINSTADRDGGQREYWLRVPPSMQTAREAVAWTFDMDKDEYTPLIET
jgi:hypothetical protein